MAKQSKTAEQQGKVEEFKEKLDEVLKPLAVAADGQAATLPFAPYSSDNYSGPYSDTLLEKANALAGKIWNGRVGYATQQFSFPIPRTPEEIGVFEKNKSYYDHVLVTNTIRRLFSINVLSNDPNGFYDHFRISDVIKKLKRLEKKYDADDIIDENLREQIINNILVPPHMYGVSDQYYNPSASFRFPTQKAVVNELLTADDVQVIDSVIHYIPMIRSLLASFTPGNGQPVNRDRLLAKWLPDGKRTWFSAEDKQFLSDLMNFSNFFHCALPYEVTNDLIPSMKFPKRSAMEYDTLRTKSVALRNAALGYASELEPLSTLLEAVEDIAAALQSYFSAIAAELDSCFGFISRIGVSFDKLVEESQKRIEESGSPF